jgi:antitoxin ParD1/3/4
MAKSTSVPLDDSSARFVEEQISSGRFASASEVVRTALEEMEAKRAALRAAIQEGLDSGEPRLIDRAAFYAEARARSSKSIG